MLNILNKIAAIFCLVLISATASARTVDIGPQRNNYPIVLVHGFMGWGEGEVLLPDGTPFMYWGYTPKGSDLDILKILNTYAPNGKPYRAYEASVGPITMDEHRAVELYAQLVGGVADYGAASAAEYGHNQFGRYYKPIIADPKTGASLFCRKGFAEKIHLVGHSMGGTTIRMFAELMANGDPVERQYAEEHPGTKLSPLFRGGMWHCIESITTLSSPHNGTSVTYLLGKIPNLQKIFVQATVLSEGLRFNNFDFDVGYWGIHRQAFESWPNYLQKVSASPLWDTPATVLYSASPEGAYRQNAWVAAEPRIYYFSQATSLSHLEGLRGCYRPDEEMFPALKPMSVFMGCFSYKDKNVAIDSKWWENDGFVNTISMAGPANDDIIEPYITTNSGLLSRGMWYYLGEKRWDHGNIVGLGSDPIEIANYYHDLASLLGSLPR